MDMDNGGVRHKESRASVLGMKEQGYIVKRQNRRGGEGRAWLCLLVRDFHLFV